MRITRVVLVLLSASVLLVGAACMPQPPVGDTVAPVLSLPDDISTPATTTAGAAVTWTATATDAADGVVAVTCTPVSGSQFAAGDTVVNCSASDLAGNTANGAFTVTVTPLPPEVVTVTAGSIHTCALLNDGTARCWGYNQDGRLGNGTLTDSNLPIAVSGLTDAVAIAAGNGHTCALLIAGTVSCWGVNSSGQLGNGTFTNSNVPVVVSGLTDAVAVTAGNGHTCALLGDGTARCWGANGSGMLGNGTTTFASNVPVVVSGLSDAVAIDAGYFHTCAVLGDGTARCWGYNGLGTLGNGSSDSNVPVVVSGLTGAVAITGGTDHTCALRSDDTARCWGSNFFGQLGDGTTGGNSNVPVVVSGLTDAVAIDAGVDHTCARLGDNTVSCWGKNTNGQLGNGTTSDSNVPAVVSGLTDATAITARFNNTCALSSNGSARCWGWNQYGQLGNGTTGGNSSIPVAVVGLP
jgi:alpha-tubulin suppressor-like RCC1 family protein